MAFYTPSNFVEWLLTAAVIGSTLFTIVLYTLPSQYKPYRPDLVEESPLEEKERSHSRQFQINSSKNLRMEMSAQVVVLGDIGRSPRMQYHALSIAKHGGIVDMIGYKESDVHPGVAANSSINIVPLPPVPSFLQTSNKLFFLFFAPLKVLWQAWSLYHAMGYRTKPTKWMLVQNPPSIPTLVVAQTVCFFRNTRLVVDWHNYGYSILALKLGQSHPFVRISKFYELIFSWSAMIHLAVTKAMVRSLNANFGISALTLHDRPYPTYQPLTKGQRTSFLTRFPETAQYAQDLQSGAWKLIVSPTSWTADEDFSILLDALVGYSAMAVNKPRFPKILAIITGKGPMKEHYLAEIRSLNQQRKLGHVLIATAWLSSEDYASLLGSADLGVSLHTSSSGVDFPMKVIDMFGAGLPVLGWSRFEAWSELIEEDVNGKGFQGAEQLQDSLVRLLAGDDSSALRKLREGAMKESSRTWDDEWDSVAGKVFNLVR